MEKDFLWAAGEALPKMRLLAEGAIARYESELASLALSCEAALALNDVGAALYELRECIAALQRA